MTMDGERYEKNVSRWRHYRVPKNMTAAQVEKYLRNYGIEAHVGNDLVIYGDLQGIATHVFLNDLQWEWS